MYATYESTSEVSSSYIYIFTVIIYYETIILVQNIKLSRILLTLKIVLSGEDAFEKDLSKSPTLGRGKQGSKMDMI